MDEETLKNRKRLMKWVTVAGIVALFALVSPILIAALGSALALMALGVLYLVFVWFGPLLSDKMATYSLKWRKENAEENPVEQITRSLQLQVKALEEESLLFTLAVAEVEVYEKETLAEAKLHPEDTQANEADAAEVVRLKADLRLQEMDLKASKDAVEEFGKAVERAESRYRRECARLKLANVGRRNTDVMNKILDDTAFKAIERKSAEANAALRTKRLMTQNLSPTKATAITYGHTLPQEPSMSELGLSSKPQLVERVK